MPGRCCLCELQKKKFLCPACFNKAAASRQADVAALGTERDAQLARLQEALAAQVRAGPARQGGGPNSAGSYAWSALPLTYRELLPAPSLAFPSSLGLGPLAAAAGGRACARAAAVGGAGGPARVAGARGGAGGPAGGTWPEPSLAMHILAA